MSVLRESVVLAAARPGTNRWDRFSATGSVSSPGQILTGCRKSCSRRRAARGDYLDEVRVVDVIKAASGHLFHDEAQARSRPIHGPNPTLSGALEDDELADEVRIEGEVAAHSESLLSHAGQRGAVEITRGLAIAHRPSPDLRPIH